MSAQTLLENFYMLKEAGHDLSRVERYALMVDEAATKALPRHHAHRVKLECHYDEPIPLNKKAALENFYLVKEASKEKVLKDLSIKTLRKQNYRRLAGLDKPMNHLIYEPGYFARQHLKNLRSLSRRK